jgi:hypothetical protein
MKWFPFPASVVFCCLAIFSNVVQSQDRYQGCPFTLNGTWRSSTAGQTNPNLTRFSNGIMTELSRRNSSDGHDWHATEKSSYKLDDPNKPTAMILTKMGGTGSPSANTTLDIKAFDDGMFLTAPAGEKTGDLTRWIRIDHYRYFLILAAGKGDPMTGGPAFAELIKTDGIHTQTDALGTWPVHRQFDSYPAMGVISEDLIKHFENGPLNNEDEYVFRLQLTAGPYNRALEVLKSWQRRVAEGNTLYAVVYENNEVFLNQLVSSLDEADELAWNQGTPCGDTIKLYRLTWLLNDKVVAQHNMSQVPYYFFRKLRELNSSLHLTDSEFRAAMAGDQSGPIAVNQPSAR